MRTRDDRPEKVIYPHQGRIPAARLALLDQTYRRRLDDDLEALFTRACIANDVEAAGELLELMEKWHARRLLRHGEERRRIDDTAIQAARYELAQLKATRDGTA
jgi:hypothetical protein